LPHKGGGMETDMKTAILGGGTWGVALAKLLSENGNDVTVWSALPAEIDALAETSRHPNLPGVVLPNELKYTKDIAEAVTGSKYIIFAVASAYIRSTAKAVAPYITEDHIIIDVAKGMDISFDDYVIYLARDYYKTYSAAQMEADWHDEFVGVEAEFAGDVNDYINMKTAEVRKGYDIVILMG